MPLLCVKSTPSPMIKRILYIALGIFVLAQFVQPDRSVPVVDPALDMLQMTGAPADIQQMVVGACYDCHSYQVQYPVWAYITPVNFWVQEHINEGREEVNYSRWDQFAGTKDASKSGKTVAKGEMPPPNYAAMHGHAQLTAAQKEQLVAWFNANIGGKSTQGKGSEGEEHKDHDKD
ncbi:MAG: heme-binding domain-containing protein [Flavobacteriales bacterium]